MIIAAKKRAPLLVNASLGMGGMAIKILLTGDVNLMNVADPAVPFSLVRERVP